jgi:hypothetical protein
VFRVAVGGQKTARELRNSKDGVHVEVVAEMSRADVLNVVREVSGGSERTTECVRRRAEEDVGHVELVAG